MRRTPFANRQLSRWWFDLSKLALGGMGTLVFADWQRLQKFAFGLVLILFFVTAVNNGVVFAQMIKAEDK